VEVVSGVILQARVSASTAVYPQLEAPIMEVVRRVILQVRVPASTAVYPQLEAPLVEVVRHITDSIGKLNFPDS